MIEPEVISSYVKALVGYGIKEGLAEEIDRWVLANTIIGSLGLPDPTSGGPVIENEMEAIKGLHLYALNAGHPWGELPEEKFTGRIMGLLTPSNGSMAREFRSIIDDKGPIEATQWLYRISAATKDVRLDLASKDLRWTASTDYGDLQITVNRSKPEKDPKDIAAPKTGKAYPKCLLCPENAGFWGKPGHPERSNHRIMPIFLDGEEWFLQYSPYVYYHQHCIVFSREHRPMAIGPRTVPRILDFLDQFPHFFLGSNAALPIVGGSILDHDHFQGGNWSFPIQSASARKSWDKGSVVAEALIWPMATLRLRARDRQDMERFATSAIESWKSYDDPSWGIEKEHNSVSVIGRKVKDSYEMDLVLRNNRTSEEHPDGIFHIRPSRHHIKKENIGLIEAMGLAVLPGRLSTEMEPLSEALVGKRLSVPENWPHLEWAKGLLEKHGNGKSQEEAKGVIEREIGLVFLDALRDCSVYPDDKNGQDGLDNFIEFALRKF